MPPGSHTGSSPSWQPASPGSSGTGPGSPAPGDEDDKSPVTGDCHAGICGSRGLQCPRPPDPGLTGGRPYACPRRWARRVESCRRAAEDHASNRPTLRNLSSGPRQGRMAGVLPPPATTDPGGYLPSPGLSSGSVSALEEAEVVAAAVDEVEAVASD